MDMAILYSYPLNSCNNSHVYILKPIHALAQESILSKICLSLRAKKRFMQGSEKCGFPREEILPQALVLDMNNMNEFYMCITEIEK